MLSVDLTCVLAVFMNRMEERHAEGLIDIFLSDFVEWIEQ